MGDTTKRDAVVEESTRDVGNLWREPHELSQAIERARQLAMDQRVTIMRLVQEVTRLRAAVERVQALHAPQRFMFCAWCPTCNHEFPCETLRTLDGEL